MIRLMADTWQDAMLRPLAMAAPNGWVYSEIMAPDFRFVFALGLALAALLAIVIGRGRQPARRPVFVLMALTFASFVPWMATTGNGRYFMPYLILVGPLCIGLVSILPSTRGMKASIALIVLGLQGFALYQNNPWKPFDSWQSIPWADGSYFSIDIDPLVIVPDTTYITVSNMSLSLAAPLFPVTSRWVNLSLFNGSDVSKDTTTYAPIREILTNSKSLKLFQRSAPRAMVPSTDQPNQRAIDAINEYLRPHRLAVKEPADCQFLASKSLISNTFTATDESALEKERIKSKAGFWICTLQFPVDTPATHTLSTDGEELAKKVFERMETLCPRFFAPGQKLVGAHPAGHSRSYSSSDSSLILTRNGDLYLHYARTLNPQRISTADEVLRPGYTTDCNNFKGRSGLPWEREI